MCGIAGIVAQDAIRYSETINGMIGTLEHRGPDETGRFFFSQCLLGHTRLSIVDLSCGQQPMPDYSGRTAITFNGEIYGYQAIKSKIKDYPFKTNSDTELILAMYQRYRENLPQHLPGMFAFAIWDENLQQLVCARDRFGEKPFFYAFGRNGEFIFSSEIKSIISTGMIEPVLSKKALTHFLRRLYIHPQETVYENIFTLPPAHCLIWKNGEISISRYWHMPQSNDSIDLQEAIPEFQRLLRQSVARQLVADVPVGAFLSGGLDSSTIVALASEYKNKITTMSFGFESGANELEYAREIAKRYNTNHIELRDSDSNIADLLLLMQKIYDEPFADSSNIPTFLISKLAREHVTVVLTGDGADELLGGYSWYKTLLYMESNDPLQMVRMIWNSFKKNTQTRSYLKGKYLAGKYKNLLEAHKFQNDCFKSESLISLGLQNPRGKILEREYSLDDVMKLDLEDYMPGDILVKIDRASMANSLELRAPFLDVDFSSFCISLPHRLKVNMKADKIILRKAFEDKWTNNIRTRKKQGFGAPVNSWLKQKDVQLLKADYLEKDNLKIYNLLDKATVKKFIHKDDYQTWTLLVLSMWMEAHDFTL